MTVYTMVVLHLSTLLIVAAKGVIALIRQCATGRGTLDVASHNALGTIMTNPLNGKGVRSQVASLLAMITIEHNGNASHGTGIGN